MKQPSWLKNAIFYNIYPQSFYDTNGDGIGDLNGVTAKLSYIHDMGFDAIWLNPFYESPFRDAGYDVTDFYKVAPRYGTNEDFVNLCKEAKKYGIHIVIDLVAGHTSLECEWFQKSALPEKNEYSNRYIWTDSVWKKDNHRFISGYSDRDGCYFANFFYCQPGLNYGYYKPDPEKPWQLPMDHPDCIATRTELWNIMEYWIGLGADGFRVDMAQSLIKNDENYAGVKSLWQEFRKKFDEKYPECILISEWSYPEHAIEAGFHADFLIHVHLSAYTTLFRHEEGTDLNKAWLGHSYFRKDGKGDFRLFYDEYKKQYEKTKGKGYISIPSGNHDIPRLSYKRDDADMKAALAFVLTMPGLPFVYYGDEIAMRFHPHMRSKEGAYYRTGARTPMQWESGKNLGFSTADTLYLPVDDAPDAPTVEAQEKDENSVLHFVRKMNALRHTHSALNADGELILLSENYPLVFERKDATETIKVIINPSDHSYTLDCDATEVLISENTSLSHGKAEIGSRGILICK
ncbi:MAG: glycosylase [Clostridia bacterium]|nr:glycosylase [Clostridia bacterium]